MSTPTAVFDARVDVLKERVRLLYWAFRRYKLAAEIEPDPAFPGFCDDRPLRAEPLAHLPPSAFRIYQWKAITTWGSIDDFKHFLPRLFELIASESWGAAHPQIDQFLVFTKLSRGEWRRWPSVEQQALDGFFEALWTALLARPLDTIGPAWGYYCASDWLSDFALVYADLGSFLRRWETDAADPNMGWVAAAHLANTIVHSREDLLEHDALRWHRSPPLQAQESQVTCWLASNTVSRLLEEAFFRWADTPSASLISEGHYWQAWWLQRRSGLA